MMPKTFVGLLLVAITLFGCSGAPPSAPDERDQSEALASLEVNGHTLNAREAKWMRYVASDVFTHLKGTRDARLVVVSRAAWWSLKEGDFDTDVPPAYSNCNGTDGDHLIGPLEICAAHRAWQVGLAGVQVPGHPVADLEELANELYPGESINDVLADAAEEAGYAPGSDTSNAIVASEGTLRASWLLRRSAIGFTVVERSEVVPECITGDEGWCYGSSWDTTALYSPSKKAALKSMADIQTLIANLAP